MAYTLSNEQTELQDSVRSFFAEQLTSTYLRKRIESKQDSDPIFWKKLCELGLFELFGDEEAATGMRELGLIAHESGRALCPENIVEHLLLGPFLAGKLEAKHAELKAQLISPNNRASLARIGSSNEFKFVCCANSATHFVALTPQAASIVSKSEANPRVADREVLDGTLKRSDLTLDLRKQLALPSALAALIDNCDMALRASELAGVCARCVEMTCEYVKTRKQFDAPIGSFQAVQHKLAEMHARAESMRALADFACWAAAHSPDQLSLAANSALIYATQHAGAVAEAAIQLHGGIGFTWEYDLHLYLRRAKSVEALYKTSDRQIELMLGQS